MQALIMGCGFNFFCIAVAMCDLVHKVEKLFQIKLLTTTRNFLLITNNARGTTV